MSLVSLKALYLTMGEQHLLDDAELVISRGDKIALIGRNGEGKTTLLKLINGDILADNGEVIKPSWLNISYLPQQVPSALDGQVFDVVLSGLGELGLLIKQYSTLSQKNKDSDQLNSLQQNIENKNGWQILHKVNTILSRMELNGDDEIGTLSGGLKRRVLLAQALVNEPDLLLLDEPTNHLDLQSIQWLEAFLNSYQGTLIIITHDRVFLNQVANKIVELDRGKLYMYPGNYTNYLRRVDERLHAEQKANELFDKKLKKEETWIRQGIKARRTRNEGRVRALKKMRSQRFERRNRNAALKAIDIKTTQSGKKVIEADKISYSINGKIIVDTFSLLLTRGDKIGVLGPNGCGKTTLLQLLLGKITPNSGTIEFGTKLKIGYFDQMRKQLDDKLSILDNIAQGRQEVVINGKPKHVISYLEDFLFSPKRIYQPIDKLSGGERNRLLLAKLFTEDVNVLVMDEPTNDLDIETLELLESILVSYSGTLLLVSHDREFINNVVTSVIVHEDNGQFNEYIGGYDDYVTVRKQRANQSKLNKEHKKKASTKLSYNEQRELNNLPQQIDSLECEIKAAQAQISANDFYQRSSQDITNEHEKLKTKEKELEMLFARWEELEGKRD
jgi:ABC transport system ATP-binding/permease protein